MASGSESAAEKVGPGWAVSPTEDLVQALMETLVDPLLPLRLSNVPPSEDVQIAVAKQMHAVVLLYNYHHRKQKPDLVFLEFANFCKLAIVIRPPLIAFMKMMKESKLQELDGTEERLSVTEKAIKDACDIALGLDASRDVPNMEGWPISKLVVLLIDSKKENCMLQAGAVTEGALSLIVKELNQSSIPSEISAGNKVGSKRKRDNLSTYNTEFLQLGYDVVKDVTGISISELEVLETHMTYSLTKEKSAAWFYIMQCSGSFDEHKQVPLKFLVESVQGPLAEKFANGLWKTTPLVKLHYMLPYMEIILSWFARLEMEMNSSDQKASENCYRNKKFGDSSPGRVASPPADIFQSTEKYCNLTSKFAKRFEIPDSAESSQNGVLENLADGNEQPDKGLSSSRSRGLYEMLVKVDTVPTMEAANIIILEKADAQSNDPVTGQSRRLFGKTVADNSLREKLKEKHDVGDSSQNDERRICPEILDEERVECCKIISASPPRALNTTNINGVSNICTDSADNKMPNTKIIVHHYRRKKNQSLKNFVQFQEAVPDLKVDMAGSLESNLTQRRDEKVSGDEGYLTNTCNLTGSTSSGDQRTQLEAKTKHNVEVQGTLDSFRSNESQRRYEKVFEDEGYLTNTENQSGTASTGNQQAQLQAEIKHIVEVQCTLESLGSDHIRSKDEIVSGDMGDHTHHGNHTGITVMGNQLAQQGNNHPHLQCNRTGDEGYLTNTNNETGTASRGNRQAQLQAEIKDIVEVQSTLESLRQDHIRSRDEIVSGDMGDHTHQCNHTGIAVMGNQLAQSEANRKNDLGANTISISASDQLQNALALLYRKRRELYSQICTMEDTLALCEDNVARIRDHGEVDLARQCINSVISGKFRSVMGNGTQDENSKSQHGKPTRLSEAYLPGKSSCQDLEYTCQRNNWRLPRYLTESSDGKFVSNVVVKGKTFMLDAKGGLEANPCEARETAAAKMITLMHNRFLQSSLV
ncbi:uncharacterized protein LOC131020788 [Salvia miltiorrhiza]|uniref:uncharacterized protein LOC131020788 n=1 Tax=Salvia miltiorrhiza TaxID=226208 RepID=UPI0025AC45C6|nr:uncharacterized protein LOC131020788 [Salvia miltiorrhiza]XP_057805794.1 uncharacterized protein LOC131020788 [Salvia miltiorrhiza]